MLAAYLQLRKFCAGLRPFLSEVCWQPYWSNHLHRTRPGAQSLSRDLVQLEMWGDKASFFRGWYSTVSGFLGWEPYWCWITRFSSIFSDSNVGDVSNRPRTRQHRKSPCWGWGRRGTWKCTVTGEIHWTMVPVPISRGPFFQFSDTIIWIYWIYVAFSFLKGLQRIPCRIWHVWHGEFRFHSPRSQLAGQGSYMAKRTPTYSYRPKFRHEVAFESNICGYGNLKVWKIKWFSGAILGCS